MENIEKAAYISVGRACGFAGFAIMCIMVGTCFNPMLSMKCGGTLTFLMTLILIYRAKTAFRISYRDTETWLILKASEDKPPAEFAQQVISTALRDAYTWFARYTALVTIVLWAIVVLLSLLLIN